MLCQGFTFVAVAFCLGAIALNGAHAAQSVEISMDVTVRSGSKTISYKVEPLPDSYAEVGEGPHWDVATQSLYYVDIPPGKLLRYDYKQNKVYKCQIKGNKPAGFIVPVEGQPGKFAVGSARHLEIVAWDGVSKKCPVEKTLFEVQAGDKFIDNRFNDGKCDPRGRLFAGTMYGKVGDEFNKRLGELYKYEAGKVEVVKGDVGISNGLAFNEKKKKFYYIDTTDFDLKQYDYNVNTGVASNPKVIYDFRTTSPKGYLQPDGMTIDSKGDLYVATFNGSAVYKVNPRNGKVQFEIRLPCKQVTSAAFGGPNLDILFVTTSAKFGEPQPAGTTYKVTGLGATGLPMTKIKV